MTSFPLSIFSDMVHPGAGRRVQLVCGEHGLPGLKALEELIWQCWWLHCRLVQKWSSALFSLLLWRYLPTWGRQLLLLRIVQQCHSKIRRSVAHLAAAWAALRLSVSALFCSLQLLCIKTSSPTPLRLGDFVSLACAPEVVRWGKGKWGCRWEDTQWGSCPVPVHSQVCACR